LSEVQQARERLALDELVQLQVAIGARRQALLSQAPGRPCAGNNRLIKPFLAQLGFRLTAAQTKVLRELRADLGSGRPMRRLLQGDVGSGKTVVAACSALLCLESGFDVALMAPTEILAEQHFNTLCRWFEPLRVPVHVQTGSRKTLEDPAQPTLDLPIGQPGTPALEAGVPADNPRSYEPLRPEPTPNAAIAKVVIGTHALIESSFTLDNLGLVIIDEQHRFGVAQREKLVRKGQYPHLLVMTATPIPRTLGLTLYGDLDISVIDELPPGRSPIRTFVRSAKSLPKVWEFIRGKLAEGRQAFVVFPRVEDTGQGVKAVTEEFRRLERELAPARVGMLHGRLRADEKERVMAEFRTNGLQVLLSTSLIEVGIDVPNATIMMIDNAEQFGLAQLHQLRGRVGRGAHESYCILITQARNTDAQQRVQILAETTDGFEIAQADLKLRGPGDLLGHEQSGMPPLVFADLTEDLALVERARALARELSRAGSGCGPACPDSDQP
jgi:ATP-dependent DNA helicase RecG